MSSSADRASDDAHLEDAQPYDKTIDIAACRRRQQRLLSAIRDHKLDMVIVVRNEHVQWLAGPRYPGTFSPLAALDREGCLTLVAPNQPPPVAAADRIATYEAQWLCTLRNDQGVAAAAALGKALTKDPRPRRVGVEFSVCGPAVVGQLAGDVLAGDVQLVDIEPDLFRLRRRKEPDELARLKRAIAGAAAMHALAREIIAPGINELRVFSELQAAAVRAYGEPMTGTGNDYASGERGGPPRDRAIQAGELYILDLGPAYQGYFADNTRVYSVDRRPTDAQLKAWELILPVFELVKRTVRPGASCQELFREANAMLDRGRPWEFGHHLGHGIGLNPHEAPHLNSCWDDRFEEGDVFACEPGLYGTDLRAGIRLENNYLVTANGVELLTPFPLEL